MTTYARKSTTFDNRLEGEFLHSKIGLKRERKSLFRKEWDDEKNADNHEGLAIHGHVW